VAGRSALPTVNEAQNVVHVAPGRLARAWRCYVTIFRRLAGCSRSEAGRGCCRRRLID
jgi:hypothetical protein